MSIAEGLSGIFEDPSLTNRANTWSHPQTFSATPTVQGVAQVFNCNPLGNTAFMDAPTGIPFVTQYGGVATNGLETNGTYRNFINGLSACVTPAASAPAIASGTVYQNTSASYQTLYIPVYASTAGTAGTAAFALGTSATPATIFTQYVSGSTASTSQEVITVRIPPQWYFSLTVTGATIGTVTQIQE